DGRRVCPADQHSCSTVEDTVEAHTVQVTADRRGVMASCLDIDEQTVTEAGEPGRVEVPGAGQIRQGLDAATDEATPHVEVAAEGVQPRPTAGGLQHVLVHLRMLDVVHISLSVHSRRRL